MNTQVHNTSHNNANAAQVTHHEHARTEDINQAAAIAAELGAINTVNTTKHVPEGVSAAQKEVAAKTKEEEAAIEAAKQELHRTIKANFNNQVDVEEVKFHFRKVKNEETGLETKRPTVAIPIPSPSVEGIIAIIEGGGKGLELLLEAVKSYVVEVARDHINENEGVTTESFPFDMLGWEKIANMPKAERRGGGIAKEVWEEFAKDYIAVMPGATGKSVDKITLAAKVLLNKFSAIKTNKPVLKLLQEQLTVYTNATPNAEAFVECIDFLNNKAKVLLETDSSNLLEAL